MVVEPVMPYSFELGPIRPPSEAYSLLIRVTRNCPWNRCKFCHTYKGAKFQIRSVPEIKEEIDTVKRIQDRIKAFAGTPDYEGDIKQAATMVLNNPPNESFFNVAMWLYSGGENAFLQDANTLIMKTGDLVEVINYLRETLPSIKRITSYGRSKTAAKKTPEELTRLRDAGLSRLHIGLETGYDPLLQFIDKGITAAEHIEGGKKVVASGISLCEYVILGLGGKEMWYEHATETARVLNETNPDFIRVRTLTVRPNMPLHGEIEEGNFTRLTDEEIVEEEKVFIEHLECQSSYISDHITNLLQEIEGKLPQDKERMLSVINNFQALPPEEKRGFIIGRRMGVYTYLDDRHDAQKREMIERAIQNLCQDGRELDDTTIHKLMARFI